MKRAALDHAARPWLTKFHAIRLTVAIALGLLVAAISVGQTWPELTPERWAGMNTVTLSELLGNGCDPNEESDRGVTALIYMGAYGRDPEVIRVLVERGADPNQGPAGFTPLMSAVRGNSCAIVEALVQAGAEINAQDVDGWTALVLALTYNPDLQMTQTLLDLGADPNLRDGYGQSPLALAAGYGMPDHVVRWLIDAGADVNAQESDGWTSLMIAATNSDQAVVRLLLDSGADANARHRSGRTALMAAAQENDTEGVIRALLAAGADPNLRDNSDRTALMVSAEHSDNPEVLLALVEGGAMINARGQHDWTPLMYAASFADNPDIVTVLLQLGADPKLTAVDGATAGILARSNPALGGTEVLRRLNLPRAE